MRLIFSTLLLLCYTPEEWSSEAHKQAPRGAPQLPKKCMYPRHWLTKCFHGIYVIGHLFAPRGAFAATQDASYCMDCRLFFYVLLASRRPHSLSLCLDCFSHSLSLSLSTLLPRSLALSQSCARSLTLSPSPSFSLAICLSSHGSRGSQRLMSYDMRRRIHACHMTESQRLMYACHMI